MSQKKKQIRNKFRTDVANRDNHRCAIPECAVQDEGQHDPHHITDRNEMPNGGYVMSNGIFLCPSCHQKAEQFHISGIPFPGYAPEDLYRIIKSSYDQAVKDSKRLGE